MAGNNKFREHLLCMISVMGILVITTIMSVWLSAVGVEDENLIMLYLIAVLLSTVVSRGYIIYGFITAVLGLLSFNFFFTDPLYTMLVYDVQDLIMLGLFFVTALIGWVMTSKYKQQSRIAKQNELTAQLMYEITESFVNLTGVDDIVGNAREFIADYTGYYCEVTLGDKTYPSLDEPRPAVKCYSLPINGKTSQLGVMKLYADEESVGEDDDKLINAVVYQMGLVLDRESIYTEREKIKLEMESEHLKSTLLRSVSHDIRTPLTGIVGASNLIVENYRHLDDEEIIRLAKDITEESEWLIMTVQNILNMTRVNDKTFSLQREIEAVDDLMSQAVTRISRAYPADAAEKLKVELPGELLFVNVDGQMFEQVLINLLDNAFKHSVNASVICFTAYKYGDNVLFEISDNGEGIDESIINTVFDGFVTIKSKTSDKGRGIGLGLSICRAIVNAHSGTITAENTASGGAVFRVAIPCEEES